MNNEEIYIINSFSYNVDGKTQIYAINYIDKISIGHEITGEDNLEKYIQDKTQLLLNERIFDSVTIEYIIGQPLDNEKIPVDLIIHVKDSANIIIIPYPQYSSNDGLGISFKIRNYNFFGTMNPLKIDLGYQRDNEGYNTFAFLLETNVPFYLLGHYWNFIFENEFHYRPDVKESFFYNNTTGLTLEFPIKNTTITAGFIENFLLNDENKRRYWTGYGQFQEGFYMSSTPFISWEIPTGFEIFDLGEIIYTPQLSVTFIHEFQQFPIEWFRKGPYFEFTHNLEFSRINWIGNFRSGLSFNINNSVIYNLYKSQNDIQPWDTNLEISGIWHSIINENIGISTCLMYQHWFFSDYHEEAGDVLRGILDKDLNANYMLSYNFEINFKVLEFRPSVWFDKNSFRYFNFDLHLVPIFAAALYNDPVNDISFDIKNIILCGGFEFLIFPQMWRSFLLRASIAFGYHSSGFNNRLNREIYIGSDFHF